MKKTQRSYNSTLRAKSDKKTKQLLQENELKKLVLMIKQAFKFLDTLSLSPKDKVMLLIRETYQIIGAVVIRNTIKVMHNPAPGQWPSICLLPYKDMFKYITIFKSPRVLRLINKNITIRMNGSTALPSVRFFPFGVSGHLAVAPPVNHYTLSASLPLTANKLATIKTGMAMFLTIFYHICSIHIPIVAYKELDIQ